MSNKATELNAAKERLSELINELQAREREYDAAIEHSAHYLGNDEEIERIRDEKASHAFETVSSVKKEIMSQVKLLEAIVANY